MILVDTSVWIEILKDQSGHIVRAFQECIGNEAIVLTRFNQLELLQVQKGRKNGRCSMITSRLNIILRLRNIPGGRLLRFILN